MSTPSSSQQNFQIPVQDIDNVVGKNGFLGRGLHGVVRLGFHRKHGPVALKCSAVTIGGAGLKFAENKIEKEIGFLRQIKHDNIVNLHGWTSWNESIALVLEYFSIGDLKSFLLNQDQITVPLKLSFIADIAKGLAFLHKYSGDQRLLHGDIKPENILMNDSLECKISDFGSAMLKNYTQSISCAPKDDSTKYKHHYTLLYAPPEYLDEPWYGNISQKYDVYSFAVTMHVIIAPEVISQMSESDNILWEKKIIVGKRFPIKPITVQIESLKQQSKNEEAEQLHQLLTTMERCWDQVKEQRPTMEEVKDQLLGLLKSWDISGHISDALKTIHVTNPTRETCECVPLEKTFPPDFCPIGNVNNLKMLQFHSPDVSSSTPIQSSITSDNQDEDQSNSQSKSESFSYQSHNADVSAAVESNSQPPTPRRPRSIYSDVTYTLENIKPTPPAVKQEKEKNLETTPEVKETETKELSTDAPRRYVNMLPWMSQTKLNKESTHIQLDNLPGEDESWFKKNLNRKATEIKLKLNGEEGCFLVRESTKASQQASYVLSVLSRKDSEDDVTIVGHYPIRTNKEGLYYLNKNHPHPTLKKLIQYHKYNPGGLIARLKQDPYSKSGSKENYFWLKETQWIIKSCDIEMCDKIGEGEFAMLLRAKLQGKAEVVVKKLKENKMSDDDFVEEAKMMSLLKHKNVVEFVGVVLDQNPIWLVSEFMENGSLLEYLRTNKELVRHPQYLLDFCYQVCEGMRYLEKTKIIHRDLAARNCLVDEQVTVKLADFGHSRYVPDDEYTCSPGKKSAIRWASPEVIQWNRFSSKSDVWAFGVLMWEVFTGGARPYHNSQGSEVVKQIMKGNYLEKPASCPDEVYSIMQQTWDMRPCDRPMFSDLFRILQETTCFENFDETNVPLNEFEDVEDEFDEDFVEAVTQNLEVEGEYFSISTESRSRQYDVSKASLFDDNEDYYSQVFEEDEAGYEVFPILECETEYDVSYDASSSSNRSVANSSTEYPNVPKECKNMTEAKASRVLPQQKLPPPLPSGPHPQHPVLMPQHPVSMPQHPVSMPQHPVSMPQHPVSMSQHPVSMPQHPVLMPQHPVLMPQHPVSMPQHPVSMSHEPSMPQPKIIKKKNPFHKIKKIMKNDHEK